MRALIRACLFVLCVALAVSSVQPTALAAESQVGVPVSAPKSAVGPVTALDTGESAGRVLAEDSSPCTSYSQHEDVSPIIEECVGGVVTNSRQDYISPGCITAVRATIPGAEYYRSEVNNCQGRPDPLAESDSRIYAEAMASARIIAIYNARYGVLGKTGTRFKVTPNEHWEINLDNPKKFGYTAMNGRLVTPDTLRADWFAYDSSGETTNPTVYIGEFKQTHRRGRLRAVTSSESQINASIQAAEDAGLNAQAFEFDPDFRDTFDILLQGCANPETTTRSWLEYTVYPAPETVGLMLIDREDRKRPCSENDRIHDANIGSEEDEGSTHGVNDGTPQGADYALCLLGSGLLVGTTALYLSGSLAQESWRVAQPVYVMGSPSSVALLEATPAAATAAESAAIGANVRAVFANPYTANAMGAAVIAVIANCLDTPNAYGDPHLVTLDGLSFDLQSVGEFHLVKAGDDLDVQARFNPSNGFSVLGGVAVRSRGDKVEFRPDGTTLINGHDDIAVVDGVYDLPGGSVLVRSGTQRLLATDDPGSLVAYDGQTLSVRTAGDVHPVGLLGNNDGDPMNDLRTAGGTSVSPTASLELLYGAFGESWRITDEESAFTYGPGQSTATFSAPPPATRTLAEFPADDIDAATQSCRGELVSEGPAMDDCVFDILVVGDTRFTAATAAVRDDAVDPTRASFVDGHMDEDFAAPVPTDFAAAEYVNLGDGNRAVGPLYSGDHYRVAVAGVPRHDTNDVTVDLTVLGDAEADEQTQMADVSVNDEAPWRVVLEGDDPNDETTPADPDVQVELLDTGTTPSGVAYRTYRVALHHTDTAGAATVKVTPLNFHGGFNTALAVDSFTMDLTTPPPDPFEVTVPLHVDDGEINGAPTQGAGRLETAGGLDRYEFTLTAEEVRRGVTVEGDCEVIRGARPFLIADGKTLSYSTDWYCQTRHFHPTQAGTYAIEVSGIGARGYSFDVFVNPEPQAFTYEIGQEVSSGSVGGVATPGAGVLETSISKDSYTFTVPAGGQTVIFAGDGWTSPCLQSSQLIRVATGEVLGGVCASTATEYTLTEGAYRIDIASGGYWPQGAYRFASYVKPDPQAFEYAIGQVVSPNVIDDVPTEGAGVLETTASKDVYSFSVPASGATVIFSGSGYAQPCYQTSALIRVDTGDVLGGVCGGPNEYTLTGGDYRIEVASGGYWPQGGYSFSSYIKPGTQAFTYEVGQTVSPNVIGDVPAEGAGVLETTASKDTYVFSVPAGGQTVVFSGSGYAQPCYQTSALIRVDTGHVLGGVCGGPNQYTLSEGDYRIEVASGGYWPQGGYWFSSYVKPDPQAFTYEVGQTVSPNVIGNVAAEGAGLLETTMSKDVYTFSIPAGGQTVVFSGSGYAQPCYQTSALIRVDAGDVLGPVCGGPNQYTLAEGDYRIEVASGGYWPQGGYWFSSYVKPEPQSFTYGIGQTVSPNVIDNVPAEGAGVLETTVSKDIYLFSIPAGGQTVIFSGSGYAQPCYQTSALIRVDTGDVLGPVCGGPNQYTLAEGDYRIEVASGGYWPQGGYWFSSYVKPDPQSFAYVVGQTVSPNLVGDVPAEGAGVLETTVSKDIYTFSIPAGGQTVIFSGSGYAQPCYQTSALIRVDTGDVLGPVCGGPNQYTLAEGDYRVEVASGGYWPQGGYWFSSALAPVAPTGLSLTPGVTQLAASWTAPAGGPTVTDYVIEYSVSGSGSWTVFSDGTSTATSATITGLTGSTAYDVRVSAVSASGTSSPTSTATATPLLAPVAPTELSLTAGITQLAASWTAPAGGPTVTDYVVEYRTNPSGSWTVFADGTSTATSATITALPGGTAYDVRVSAVSASGTSAPSSTATGTALLAPVAPSGLALTPGVTQLAASWTAPASGPTVTDYVVEYRTSPSGSWTVFADGTSTATSATITGLTGGTAYDVRVKAVSASGTSSPSSTATGTALLAPVAPTGLSLTAGVTQLAASWTAPAGGPTVTDYLVEYRTSPSGSWTVFADGTSTATSATITGLTGGTAYDVRVKAVSASGTSSPSSTATGTPTTGPQPPTGLSLTPGVTQLVASWTAPAGGPTVTDYVVEYRTSPSGSWTVFADGTSTATSATITGLTGSTAYDVRIKTVTGAGTSAPSSTATGTALLAPVAPTGLSLTAGPGQLAASWTAPAGGPTVTDYVVEYRTSPSGTWTVFADGTSTTRTATITGLTGGTAYNVRVSAVSASGTSAPSSTATGTPTTGPQPPTGLSLTAGVTQLAASWTAPTTGPTVTDYVVEYRTSPSGTWTVFADGTSTTRNATITGLTGGTAYDVRIKTVTASGTSSPSATATGTALLAPVAPTGLSLTPGVTQLAASWTAPAGGPTVTDYVVEYRTSPSGSWTVFADGTSTATNSTITGLTGATAYDVRVKAVSASGTSSPSSTATGTPLLAPVAPSGLSLTAGPGQLSASWSAPAGGPTVTDYVVEYRTSPSGSWTVFADGTSTTRTATITGLTGGTAYSVRVSAVSASGTSSPSSTATGTPTTGPQPPTGLSLTAGVTQLAASWTAPTTGPTVTDYVVEYSVSGSGSWTVFADGTSTTRTATITGLTGGTAYDVRIKTVTASGTSAPSSTATGTALLAPVAPSGLSVTAGVSQLAASWTAPAGGPTVTDYVVEYRTSPSGSWTVFADGTSTDTSTTITGLTGGTAYDVRVKAVSASGTSAPSSTATGTALLAPVAPSGLALTAGVAQLAASWTAPAGGPTVTDYVVEYRTSPSGSWTVFADGASTATSATVTGLTGGTAYDVRVKAVSASGTSAPSGTASGTPTT